MATHGQEAGAPVPSLADVVEGCLRRRLAPVTLTEIFCAFVEENQVQPRDLPMGLLCSLLAHVLPHALPPASLLQLLSFASNHPRADAELPLSTAVQCLSLVARQTASQALEGRVSPELTGHLDRWAAIHLLQWGEVDRPTRVRLANALKALPASLTHDLWQGAPAANRLRALLSAPSDISAYGPRKPQAVLQEVLEAPDTDLARRGPQGYPVQEAGTWKLNHFHTVLPLFRGGTWSLFKQGFVAEWLLMGSTASADSDGLLGRCLQEFLSMASAQPEPALFVQCLYWALQQEVNRNPAGGPRVTFLLARGLLGALGTISPAAPLAHWARGLAQGSGPRLLEDGDWNWLAMFSSGIWTADLGEPPPWCIACAAQVAPAVIHLAPAPWLTTFAPALLRQLHQDTLRADFTEAPAHRDFAEYLARALEKKVPVFSAKPEVLLALRLLGRATTSELGSLDIASARLRLLQERGLRLRPGDSPLLALYALEGREPAGSHPTSKALGILVGLGSKGARDAALHGP